MRSRSLIPLVIAASLAAAGIASAAETGGVVKSVDMAKHAVTLQDGTRFGFPQSATGTETFPLDGYKAGDHVKITWTVMQGKKVGQAIAAENG